MEKYPSPSDGHIQFKPENFYLVPEGYTIVSEEDLEGLKRTSTRNGYLEGFTKGYDRGWEDGTAADADTRRD